MSQPMTTWAFLRWMGSSAIILAVLYAITH